MRALAREVRGEYGFATPRVGRSDLRRIYRSEGIRIDLWPYPFRNLRGPYFNDEFGVNVMLMKNMPEDLMVFTMAHELKHHFVDSGLIPSGWGFDEPNPVEIGAEIFAAELIYPERDFRSDLERRGIQSGKCSAGIMLRFKREMRTTLPCRVLAQRSISMGLASASAFEGQCWKRLEKENW
jgi:Zn-dependent peptidase ImmA (M78 family)